MIFVLQKGFVNPITLHQIRGKGNGICLFPSTDVHFILHLLYKKNTCRHCLIGNHLFHTILTVQLVQACCEPKYSGRKEHTINEVSANQPLLMQCFFLLCNCACNSTDLYLFILTGKEKLPGCRRCGGGGILWRRSMCTVSLFINNLDSGNTYELDTTYQIPDTSHTRNQSVH